MCIIDLNICNILAQYIINKYMAEEEAAFDDWQMEAEAVVEEAEVLPTEEKKEIGETKPITETDKETKLQVQKKPVDLTKALLQKIQQYKKITNEQFPQFYEEIKNQSTNNDVILSNEILKNEKDFAKFAKGVSKRLNDEVEEDDVQTLEEGNILTFVQQLLLLLYEQLQWKNMEATKQKLKIVKKERKQEEIKAKKQKQKEEKVKRERKDLEQQESHNSKYQTKAEDDIFEGTTLINSKQEEEERKNKQVKKIQAPPADDDDDDFM